MVGMMAAISREKIAGLINSSKFDVNILSKLEKLRLLDDELSKADPVLLSEFVSPLLDLLSDRSSPVRKFTAEYDNSSTHFLEIYNLIRYLGILFGNFLEILNLKYIFLVI